MENKLKTSPEYREPITFLLATHPSLIRYFNDVVCKEIGCSLKEMVCLDIHPDNIEDDEEGWEVESFFPKDAKLEKTTLFENYEVFDFSVGHVQKITYNGHVFIAEACNSPYIIYANPNNI